LLVGNHDAEHTTTVELHAGDRVRQQVRVPLLVAVAPDDEYSPIAEVRALLRRARPDLTQFVQLPAGAGHGWDTVNDPADPSRRSAFSGRLVGFLDRQLH
jgi:dienelactone hydrolase